MSLPLLATLVLLVLALGYTLYGRFIARQYALDDARTTPAVAREDGVDFVPTRPFYLMGQHFSAIAAAGPIVGPILACSAFGWAPCLLWIGLGVVFVGAVHDLSALVASVRHGARSVAEVVRTNLGPTAWRAMLAFIWLALVYVLVAFADTTAGTFVGATRDLPDGVPFNPGGAVAAAAVTYLLLALAMGFVQRRWNPPLVLLTLVFVPATLAAVWLGTQVSTWLVLERRTWALLVMGYCFVASLLPVRTLLQPRGYLGGFVLYIALAIGVLGVFFGGFEVRAPAFRDAPLFGMSTAAMAPFLFVTIACGACSGFHGLVCSGTTSKQIQRESHCRAVGYGAMLLEGFVAVLALATVMIVEPSGKPEPARQYAEGMGRFLAVLTGPESLTFAVTLGAMAFSTFVFDTLDVATRLGRYLIQEFFAWPGRGGLLVGAGVTAGVPLLVLLGSQPGSFLDYWLLFGTSNQLLAGLTLLGVSVWLHRSGRRCWFTLAPMAFVMTITLWALVIEALAFARKASDAPSAGQALVPAVNAAVALVLIGLALFLLVQAARGWRRPRAVPVAEPG